MLFFWKWPALVLGILTVSFTIGTIQGIRRFWPGEEWTWSRWYAYKYGDWFLAGFVFFAAICFHKVWPTEGTSLKTHMIWLAIGILVSAGIQLKEILTGSMAENVWTLPSEWYHTVARALLIYAIGQAATALYLGDHEPKWAYYSAITCLVAYGAFFLYDSLWQDHSQVRRGHR